MDPSPLLSLPTELLIPILSYTLPYPSLILTCKHFHAIAQSTEILRDHRSLHQQWFRWESISYETIRVLRHQRDVRLGLKPKQGRQPQLGWSKNIAELRRRVDSELEEGGELAKWQLHPVELIASIVRQPEVAHYVREVNFGGLNQYIMEDAEQEDKQRVEAARSYLRKEGRLEKFVKNNRWLKAAGQDSSFWATSALQDQDSERWCCVLLLTLMPNIRTLTLGSEWRYSSYGCGLSNAPADPVISGVLHVLREKIGPHGDIALPYLHTLEQFSCDPKFGISLQTFVPFLLLPSLKRFEALKVETMLSSYDFSWPEHGECSVSDIELLHPYIESEHIGVFFSRMIKLKRLFIKYNYLTDMHWNVDAWAAGITNSSVSNTLEVLDLRTTNKAASTSFIGSLKSLRKLKKLTLDEQVLLTRIENGVHEDSDTRGGEFASLASLLPQSLEELELQFWHIPSNEDASRLFDGFAEFVSGSYRLKTLRLTVIADSAPLDWPSTSWRNTLACQMSSCGVELILGFNIKSW